LAHSAFLWVVQQIVAKTWAVTVVALNNIDLITIKVPEQSRSAVPINRKVIQNNGILGIKSNISCIASINKKRCATIN
jgi:hypothetical protein